MLAWNKTRLGWLVHSTPGWPATLSNDALPPLIASGLKCGQSFLWLGLERSEELTRRISAQIHLMDACVYAGRVTPDEEAHVGFAEDRWAPLSRAGYLIGMPPKMPGGWKAVAGQKTFYRQRCRGTALIPAGPQSPTAKLPACRFGEHLRRPYSLVPPSLVMLGTGVWHLAKDAAWGKVRLDGR